MKQKINLYLLYATVTTLLYGLIAFFIHSGSTSSIVNFRIMFFVSIAVFAYVFMALSLIQEKAPDKRSELTNRYVSHLLMFELGLQLFGALAFHIVSDFVDHISLFITVLLCLLINVPFVLLSWLPEEHKAISVIEEKDVLDHNYFSDSILYLDHVSDSAGYDALSASAKQLKTLLLRIDVPMSDPASAEAISLDVSNKCIALETAINQKDTSKILIISRQLLSLCDKIEREAQIAIICYKDPDFFHVDNEIAEAQMDLILDQYGIDEEEQIVDAQINLEDDIRFQKALRFADGAYREILNGYIVEMKSRDLRRKNTVNEKQYDKDRICSVFSSLILPLMFILSLGVFLLSVFVVHPGGFVFETLPDGTAVITGYNPLCGNDVEIPGQIRGRNVTVIGERAFKDCRKIISVKIPENVTVVKFDCFNGCRDLQTVYLPRSVEEVQMYAFKGCVSLERICYAGSQEEFEGEMNESGERISGVHFSPNGFKSTDTSSDSKSFEHFKKDGKVIYNVQY